MHPVSEAAQKIWGRKMRPAGTKVNKSSQLTAVCWGQARGKELVSGGDFGLEMLFLADNC